MSKCLYCIVKIDNLMPRNQISGYDTTYVLERILETAKSNAGSPESKIRSIVYLTFREIDWFLRHMVENGLIRYNLSTSTYKTTKHGEDFLKTIKQIGEFLNIIEE